MNEPLRYRIIVGVFSALGLFLIFLFQRIDYTVGMYTTDSYIVRFIVNRSIRFLLNDMFAIGLIYALFEEKKYVIFSLWVQIFGLLFLLLPYFVLKLYFPTYNGPLISFLHRLILNPTLILLLIPAFYFQRRISLL